jgi:hypothetical protein
MSTKSTKAWKILTVGSELAIRQSVGLGFLTHNLLELLIRYRFIRLMQIGDAQ